MGFLLSLSFGEHIFLLWENVGVKDSFILGTEHTSLNYVLQISLAVKLILKKFKQSPFYSVSDKTAKIIQIKAGLWHQKKTTSWRHGNLAVNAASCFIVVLEKFQCGLLEAQFWKN